MSVQSEVRRNYEESSGSYCNARVTRYITATRQVHLTARRLPSTLPYPPFSLSLSFTISWRVPCRSDGKGPTENRRSINSQFLRARSLSFPFVSSLSLCFSLSRQRATFRDANFRTAVEIRNFGAVSRSRDAGSFSPGDATARCIALHRVASCCRAGPGRASLLRRSLLTSRTNNACESTRYAEIRAPKDVTYDTGRHARTVHIFVGDEPLIVVLPPRRPVSHSGPGESSRLRIERAENRDRATRRPMSRRCRYKYVLLMF